MSYLSRQKFTLKTESETLLTQLRERSKIEGYSLQAQLDALEKSLSEAQIESIRKNRDLVVKLLEKEIAGRYYYQAGRIQIGLARDKEIVEAISVLKDPVRYKSLLSAP
jgi:carboxyl-terminal processing protease